jgi:hypothetical protein
MQKIREELLANGLQIDFADRSNRYFGDYHRVCVVATIVCRLRDLPAVTAEEAGFRRLAIETFGEQLCIDRRFERMAVPSADVDAVRTTLVEDYLRHAAVYLARPDTPRSLVAAELKNRQAHPFHV